MNKIVFGIALGGLLGVGDGLTSLFTPEVHPQLMAIVMGAAMKGVVTGLLIGIFALKVRSVPLGTLFGLGIGLLFAFAVAHMQGKYYEQIMTSGGIAGLIVGFATQKFKGQAFTPAARS